MSSKEEHLKSLLRKIPDGYSDFVNGLCAFSKEYNIVDEMIEFIESHDEANHDDVMDHYFKLAGFVKE